MIVDLESYPKSSIRLLSFIYEKELKSTTSTKFLEYCTEEKVEDFLYLEEENRLIVSENFRHAVRAEIREYIKAYREQYHELPLEKKETPDIKGKLYTIYGEFQLFDLPKDTILWDLLTLLIYVDSLNPQIWDRRAILIGGLLQREEIKSDYMRFLSSELNLTKLALCHTFKYGEIWSYLEYILMKYYEKIKESKLNNMNNDEIIIYILKENYDFICLQMDLYDHNYYAWSLVNWLFYDLIPTLISPKNDSSIPYSYNEIKILEKWVIRLIQKHPFQYGGYHALVNLNESKIETQNKSNKLEASLVIKLVYSEETMDMLRIIIECFNNHFVNCFSVILGFRYANFMLLIDSVDEISHFQIFENEIMWFQKQGLVEKMSKSIKNLEELREHFYSILSEISSYKYNKNIIQNYYDLLDSELQVVRQGSTMFYKSDISGILSVRMSNIQYLSENFEEYEGMEMENVYEMEKLNINSEDIDEGVDNMVSVHAAGFGVYDFESEDDEISKEITKGYGIKNETDGSVTETERTTNENEREDHLITPKKRPFLRKGEGKSLVISNSRKANGESLKKSSQVKSRTTVKSVPNSTPARKFRNSNRPDIRKVNKNAKFDSLLLGIQSSNMTMESEAEGFEIFESEEEFVGMEWDGEQNVENLKSNKNDKNKQKTSEKEQERDYENLIQQKLDLLDKKMEYIHETHEEMLKKKTLLARERKLLESYKVNFEKELKLKFEKSKQEIESEKRRLERENNKLTKDKIALSDQVTRLKMTIKAKDAEINRLTKEITQMEKKEKEREAQKSRMVSVKRENSSENVEKKRAEKFKTKIQKNEDLEISRFPGSSSITPLTTNLQTTTSISSNSSGSFMDRDLIIEEHLVNFDFEKELDLLYGILSTCFEFVGEGEDFTTLPGIPNEIGKPWCDIEKPYKIQKDDDLKTITFKFPSGLVEIVFCDEQENSICPKNTRKLLWTHLGWCILVYPNGDIKAIKPDKNITYHYVEKDIVKCVVGMRDLLNYDGEATKLYLSKFFSLGQLQCVDPETRKTYIIHSDMSKQILNG
ncbi:uncharacterized protein cubi_00475 [Cryptosporidium ubiquitum]|uniref:Uncharacterized protein n=1 Tax=Cryptosporidium ubiquitum TaxID=857276 RepID=A0A1J4ME22_9CRYT|nr:uncharacterized protein cubi_00475 [Cryptosporidium ubiquitum]OII72480.1 hypothetical protein cubi_00475 [Cryptosporidium ubiquitum]